MCESWIRRGIPAKTAAEAYKTEMAELRRQNEECKGNLIVRFEDCVSDPFSELGRMCQFLGLEWEGLGKIRIKAKRVVTGDGSHDVKFGEEGRKVWMNRQEVGGYLDQAVTGRQISCLSEEDKRVIRNTAGEVMTQFGYEV